PVKSGDRINAKLNAEIDEGWHLYALDQPSGGPIPTTVKVFEGSPFVIDGEIISPKPTTKPDPNFIVDGKPIDTKFFERSVAFNMTAKAVTDTRSDAFALNVRFQLCNDKFCLPPKSLKVTFAGSEVIKKGAQRQAEEPSTTSTLISTPRSDDSIWGFI